MNGKEVHSNVQILDYYIHAFTHLRRDSKKGGAPHKPILLLAIIHEYVLGRIFDNKIFITPEITHSFSIFWNQLVTTEHDKSFSLPFYHLSGEKGNWWQLIPNVGCEIWIDNPGSMRSFGNLSAAVAYAEIDPNLASLLLNKESREDLKNEVYEPSAEYKTKLLNLKKRLDPETYQIEVC